MGSDITGLGSYGIFPFMSEDLMKQAKYASIKTRAGKMAYLLSLGDNAQKPVIREGVEEAKGALKWIKKFADEGQG
jgi:hypothetical protein